MGFDSKPMVIDVSTKDSLTQLVVTDDAIWVPNQRPYGAKDAPGLVEMLLGSSLARKHESESTQRLLQTHLDRMDPAELERALYRVARPVPFSSVMSCWLTKGRWVARPSFGFRFFDHRRRAIGSMGFTIRREDLPRLARRLLRTIPDRFETDLSHEETYRERL